MEIEIEDLHIQMEDVAKNKLSVSSDSDVVISEEQKGVGQKC